MSTNIIELRNVRKTYDNTRDVVECFNLSIKKGEFVTFLGPSGCGKTTTLRMIAGFEQPTEGEILLHGKNISQVPANRRPINTVFQRYALFPHLNIYDNIAFGLKLKKLPKKEIDAKVERVLKIVDLEGTQKRSVDTLSGGQQQRIAIARAIVNEPEILLLDEPLGALDLKMRQEMQIELKAMHEKLGITFIYVTHDQEEALTMSDKIVVMSDGKIQQVGTAEEIYNERKNLFVADFIGESNIFNGSMTGHLKVRFCGAEFTCLDDYETGSLTNVIVRPEDVILTNPDEGMLNGTVISNIFKGIHYEITIQCGNNEIIAKSTKPQKVGDTVGIVIEPDGIHVILADQNLNHFTGHITKHHTVEFGDGEFECDVTQLYEGSHHDGKGHLFSKDGERIHLTNLAVNVEIPIRAITMSDDEEEGGCTGEIISFLYAGDHYRYTVRTKNGYDFIVYDEYLWNESDRVSLVIPKEQIKLTLK